MRDKSVVTYIMKGKMKKGRRIIMNYTLEELVYLAKQGDRDAFSEIVKQMQQRIFQYCYPMVGNRQDIFCFDVSG